VAKPLIQPVAQSVPFDNGTNGFTASNTQEAIEEARASAIAKCRFTIVCTFDGTASNNQWLSYSHFHAGNLVPIILPLNCILREVAVSFDRTGVGGQINLYKNGVSNINIIGNLSFSNDNNTKIFTGLNYQFSQGDTLRGRWQSGSGNDIRDTAIVYYFEVV
jgi:hypothetical protein